jgi:hypothetical protein
MSTSIQAAALSTDNFTAILSGALSEYRKVTGKHLEAQGSASKIYCFLLFRGCISSAAVEGRVPRSHPAADSKQ